MINIDDTDANSVLTLIHRILQQADRIAADPVTANSGIHSIYVLARDARDILVQDKISRDVLRKLSNINPVVKGVELPPAVISHMRHDGIIYAIKELRTITGIGLKEARDVIEQAYIDLNIPR